MNGNVKIKYKKQRKTPSHHLKQAFHTIEWLPKIYNLHLKGTFNIICYRKVHYKFKHFTTCSTPFT